MKKMKFLKTDSWSKCLSIYFGAHKRQIKKSKKVRQKRQRYYNFQSSEWVEFQVVNIVFWIWSRQLMKQTFCFCCCLSGYFSQCNESKLTLIWQFHFGVKELDSPQSWPQLHPTPLVMNQNANCEPGFIRHNQCQTSLILLCVNGGKSLQPGSKIIWKSLKPERMGDRTDASGFITNVSKASFYRTANFT